MNESMMLSGETDQINFFPGHEVGLHGQSLRRLQLHQPRRGRHGSVGGRRRQRPHRGGGGGGSGCCGRRLVQPRHEQPRGGRRGALGYASVSAGFFE